jgi:hypothetical protein
MDVVPLNNLGHLGRSADSVTVHYALRLSQQFFDAQVGSTPAVQACDCCDGRVLQGSLPSRRIIALDRFVFETWCCWYW